MADRRSRSARRAATAAAPTSRLYTDFRRELRCDDPATLDAVCNALDGALREGLHAVVLADYDIDKPTGGPIAEISDEGSFEFLVVLTQG